MKYNCDNCIENCCICGGGVEDVIKIKNRDIIGMAEYYEQIISICPECGFIFTRNPFSSEQFAERYSKQSKYEYDNDDYCLDYGNSYIKRALWQKKFIEQNIEDSEDIKSILEIGVASGHNLSLYSDCSRILGIEPSEQNVKNAKKFYNVDMFCGMFDDYYEKNKGSEKFDLVFSSMSLEHIVNPDSVIAKISEINNKYVFIAVPTFDYKFINEPYAMFCDEHVNMFTFESLQNLMNKYNYTCINAVYDLGLTDLVPAGDPSMLTLWKKSDKLRFFNPVISSRELLDNYIKSSKIELEKVAIKIDNIDNNKKLAVYGTGNCASKLYENTSLKEKNIVKVFDSDIKKHGMKMFGREIEPFDESIATDAVDTILVATYTAQTAIYNYLKPRFYGEIILLYDI